MSAVKLAILAAKKDEDARDTLWVHLAMLRRAGEITIAPVEEAAIVAVILSAHLVADEAIVAQIAAARARRARVCPVRYAACAYLDILPVEHSTPERHEGWIATASSGKVDELWASVATSLRRAVGEVSVGRGPLG